MKTIFKKIITYILILESRIILKKYKPYIVAVTGSVGKTSTKDAIYTVLKGTSFVRKSEKSFNGDIGIPLTILGCENGWSNPFIWMKNVLVGFEYIVFNTEYPQCLVLEIGADHPGDIEKVSKWLHPDIVVITKISDVPVHVEFFPSPEAVLKEKFFLAKGLKKDGTLIISADDKKLVEISKEIKQKVLTFGIVNSAIVSASDIALRIENGISFKINYDGNSYSININGVLGRQQVYPILAATLVGIAKNIPISNIVESFKDTVSPRGRMNILAGINGSYIIDDTYNSSPDAVHEALGALASLTVSGKKIAVLGDMMELGKFSSSEHKKAGEIAEKSCDVLVTVGPRANNMSARAVSFDDAIPAGEYVKGLVSNGDVILVKGSQSMRMERIVKELIFEKHRSHELLVRQEAEWLAKK